MLKPQKFSDPKGGDGVNAVKREDVNKEEEGVMMKERVRILLVDDDSLVLRGFEEILEREGFDVVPIDNGQEALRFLETAKFDLILTDLVMRDVHGLVILRKAQECQPDAVVIVITGFASIGSAIEALRLGAYDYLMKPCEDSELILRVRRGLEKVQLQRDLQTSELEEEKLKAIVQTAVALNDQVNTPLNVILSSTEYLQLKLKSSDAEVLQSFDYIRQEVAKIKGVIQKLARIADPKIKEYALGKIFMVDVDASQMKSTNEADELNERRKKRILVVDDEQFMVHMLSRILRLLGYETFGAFNGQQALDIFHRESVDLILSDIHMPEVNGLELLETVKRERPQVPVVLVTGYGAETGNGDQRRKQASALLSKPFKIADLKRAIDNALGIGVTYAESAAL
ncbi:response regulator [bacterium]|nr:response regulator [bacterium]